MADTTDSLPTRGPESETLPSIGDTIIARWSSADLVQRGSRIDAAVDVGGNQIILTGTVPTRADRDRAVAMAAVDSLGLLINDRIRIPAFVDADQAR